MRNVSSLARGIPLCPDEVNLVQAIWPVRNITNEKVGIKGAPINWTGSPSIHNGSVLSDVE